MTWNADRCQALIAVEVRRALRSASSVPDRTLLDAMTDDEEMIEFLERTIAAQAAEAEINADLERSAQKVQW